MVDFRLEGIFYKSYAYTLQVPDQRIYVKQEPARCDLCLTEHFKILESQNLQIAEFFWKPRNGDRRIIRPLDLKCKYIILTE